LINGVEANESRRRQGWEIVGTPWLAAGFAAWCSALRSTRSIAPRNSPPRGTACGAGRTTEFVGGTR
jgi:hypothetical protein